MLILPPQLFVTFSAPRVTRRINSLRTRKVPTVDFTVVLSLKDRQAKHQDEGPHLENRSHKRMYQLCLKLVKVRVKGVMKSIKMVLHFSKDTQELYNMFYE